MRKNLFYILLTILSSFLLTLSFPKFDLYYLAFFALVPFFYSLLCINKIRVAFLLGLIFGFFFYLSTLYWIPYTRRIGELGIPALILLSLILSFYTAIFSSITKLFLYSKRLIIKILSPCFIWVIIEYIRGIGFYGFPWASLCYSQYLNLGFIQIVDITGMYGVSFLLVLVNSTVANLIYNKRRQVLKFAIIVLLLITANYTYGYLKIIKFDNQLKNNKKFVRVALIQGNIPRDVTWTYEYMIKTLSHYMKLSSPIREKVDIIVWPESVIPFGDLKDEFLVNHLRNIARTLNKLFIVGCFDEGKKGEYFNTAAVFSDKGEIIGKYYKIQLVPFGEVVPMRWLFNLINYNPWGEGDEDLTSGKEFNVIKTKYGKLSFNICFETIFPYISRNEVKNKSELLVALVADSWFKSDTTYQHTSMATFRCIENRRYLIRCADTGISAFINPYGKIYKKTLPFTSAVIIDKVKFLQNKTFYTKYGELFVYISIFIFLIFTFDMIKERIRLTFTKF